MNIYETITKIMGETPAISKAKKNQTQGFAYRGIDDVMNAFNPLFAKYKLFIVPTILEQTREERQTAKGGNLIYSICKIKYTFYAEDGSSIDAVVIGEGMDTSDKATNKAMAIAMKYALFQVFCIPTAEMKDPDGETPPESTPTKISKTLAIALEKACDNRGYDEEYKISVLNKYGYKSFTDIETNRYSEITKEFKGE